MSSHNIDSLDKDEPARGFIKKGPKSNADNNRDDFSFIIFDVFRRINFKIAFVIFFIGIFIFSDIFIENVLDIFSGTTEAGEVTGKGTTIQLMFLAIGYIFADLLAQGEFI